MTVTYARARLFLGISGVGFWVVLASAVLLSGRSQSLPGADAPLSDQSLALLALVVAYALASFPFDLLGGWILPTRFGRPAPSGAQFLASWLRGMATKGSIYFLVGLLLLVAGRVAGWAGALGIVLLISLLLLLAQDRVARTVGALRPARGADLIPEGPLRLQLERWGIPFPRITLLESRDPGFTGGIVGWPGRDRIVLPATWTRELPPEGLAAQLTRLHGIVASGSRARGVLLGLVWNLSGFLLAFQLPGAGAGSIAELAATSCGVTLFSFLGLLVLPSFSRPSVRRGDAYARSAGVPPEVLRATMERVDRWQDDEPARSRWIERIFHPIPSLATRLRGDGTEGSPGSLGGWHLARVALYLSWASLGLLSQAVHCNAGRPELWVLLPTE